MAGRNNSKVSGNNNSNNKQLEKVEQSDEYDTDMSHVGISISIIRICPLMEQLLRYDENSLVVGCTYPRLLQLISIQLLSNILQEERESTFDKGTYH